MKWIKGTEEYTGGEFKFQINGEEYVSYAPTDDFLEEQGWTKVEDAVLPVVGKSLVAIKEEIIQECNEFYRSSILQVAFRGQLLWVPFETRQAYKVLLDDLQEAGITEVVFRDFKVTLREAREILKELNVYEYKQKQICDQHVRNIIKCSNEDEVLAYDYTANYLNNLSF